MTAVAVLHVIAGVVLAVVVLAPGDGAPAPEKYVVGQFNMAGGTTGHGGKGDVVPDALARDVGERGAALLTLQETCRDWDRRLRDRLPDYTVLFSPVDNLDEDRSPARCHHPADFGNTVVLRKGLGFERKTAATHLLGSTDGDEYRQMFCVRSPSRALAACSVHLTPGGGTRGESRLREAAEARRILAERYADHTVLLGGDVNDVPRSRTSDEFYAPGYGDGARGAFEEASGPCGDEPEAGARPVCRSGEATHDKGKIDYIFVSRSARVEWADATPSAHSDHKQLWARVSV